MSTLIKDIKSNDWQISTLGVGVVAEGLQDIRQCLDILLRTVKSTDPLRPEFGSDIFQYVDSPSTIGIPNMKRAIIEAVDLWEKRVQIVTIIHQLDKSNVRFFITYKLVDQELIDVLTLYIKGGFISVADAAQGSLILEALFPKNSSGKTLQINFTGDGKSVSPPPPSMGFGSTSDLFYWVQTNWGFYGTWYLGADRIILYLKPGIFNTASLTITASGVKRFAVLIPVLDFGSGYMLEFIPDGHAAITSPVLITVEQMLSRARSLLTIYGTWQIEAVGPLVPGDFLSVDFDPNEFITGETGYALVLYSETQINPVINIFV